MNLLTFLLHQGINYCIACDGKKGDGRMRWRNISKWLLGGILSVIALVAFVIILVTLSLGDLDSFDNLPEGDSEAEAYIAAYTSALFRATVALAAFTCLLWLAAAFTAISAVHELRASTMITSADLTLRLDERFHSDRALRIRHGAATFLLQKRGSPLRISADGTERRGLLLLNPTESAITISALTVIRNSSTGLTQI